MLMLTILSSFLIFSQAFCPIFVAPALKSTRLNLKNGNFYSLTLKELQYELRSRNLGVGGNKDALIQRLAENEESLKSMNNETNESDNEPTQQATKVNFSETATFDELGIIPELLTAIDIQQWMEPTPIQKLCIPEIMTHFKTDGEKTSLWAEAPTGSGKTGAFAIPIIQLTLENRRLERNRSKEQSSTYIDGGNKFQKNLGRQRGRRTNDERQKMGFVSTLILCPTRELAMQIGGVLEEFVEAMPTSGKDKHNIDVMVITGGFPREAQVQMLAERKLRNRNVDILVATPGRLADVLLRSTKEDSVEKELEARLLLALDEVAGNAKNDVSLSLAQLDDFDINRGIAEADDGGRSAIKDMLSNVQYLVLDEADRLLSQGFQAEMDDVLNLLPAGSKIEGTNTNSSLKTLLFSATFPEQIQPRIERVLQRLGGKGAPPPLRLSCNLPGASHGNTALSNRQQKRIERTTQPQSILEGPSSTITLRSIRIDEEHRTQALRHLLKKYGEKEWDRVLVFVDTRYASEHVARKLRRSGIKASELHGKLDQDARSRRLRDFSSGKFRVLIATDLVSRGLDISGLPAVVNFDLPRSTADFTHRVGRTGRAGNKGLAVTFVTSSNEAHYDLIEKRHLCKGSVEKEILPGFEPNEARWELRRNASDINVKGVMHSKAGIAHDRMFGGIKGKRKSKKDRLREQAARKAAEGNSL